jgi:hypothetical protein
MTMESSVAPKINGKPNTGNSESGDDTFANHLQEMEFVEKDRLNELVMGNKKAPVIVVIYFSFTCDHCHEFHTKEFPKFKKSYVDTDQVKVYLRCYLDDPASLDAAILARCLAHGAKSPFQEVSNFKKIMHAIFKVRKEWFKQWETLVANGKGEYAEKAAQQFLDNVFIKLKYSKDQIEACKLKDQVLNKETTHRHKWLTGLMMEQKRAMCEFNIESVPAFVIYNRKSGNKTPIVHQGILTSSNLAKLCGL